MREVASQAGREGVREGERVVNSTACLSDSRF